MVLICVLAISWMLFGPIRAFHHDVGFGLFGYMFCGGEDGEPGDFALLGIRFSFFPFRFAITLALWVGVLVAAHKTCRTRN